MALVRGWGKAGVSLVRGVVPWSEIGVWPWSCGAGAVALVRGWVVALVRMWGMGDGLGTSEGGGGGHGWGMCGGGRSGPRLGRGGIGVDLELAMLGVWGYWSGGVWGSKLGLNLAKAAFFG